MADLARAALSAMAVPALAARAAELVVGALPADGCEVLELWADGRLRRAAAVGSSPVSGALPASALWSAAPLAAREPEDAVPAAGAGAAHWLAARIGGVGQPYGVLSAYAARSRIFSIEEVDFLSTMTAVLTAALSGRHEQDAARYEALYDPLTGLPNRTLLWDRLGQAIARAERSGELVAVLLADVDGFDAVNESLGSAAGDAVVVGVAERLRCRLRASDTLARLGGDEFAVCLPDVRDIDHATRIAERLGAALDRPLRLGEVAVPVSTNVGVAVFPHHGTAAAAVLRHADAAREDAKLRRDPVATYRAGRDDDHGTARLSLAAELARAIDDDALELDYQPLVDLTSGAVGSAEALVRWRRAGGDVLSASDLVFLAEHSGLIRRLSAWVVDRAVRQIGAWQRQGVDLRVAVNVPGGVLEDGRFGNQLIATMSAAGLPTDRLSLEVTESVTLSESARSTLTRLAQSGMPISIDDFGTGYASLSYLKHLPVTTLKLDRSFVTRVAEDPRDLAIVRSVVELAHALGLLVVAEGVEDAPAAELLRELSADLAQGYLFSRPVPPDELTRWLLARACGSDPPTGQLTLAGLATSPAP